MDESDIAEIRKLLGAGADVNLHDKDGETIFAGVETALFNLYRR